jgi:hypothetical protein
LTWKRINFRRFAAIWCMFDVIGGCWLGSTPTR